MAPARRYRINNRATPNSVVNDAPLQSNGRLRCRLYRNSTLDSGNSTLNSLKRGNLPKSRFAKPNAARIERPPLGLGKPNDEQRSARVVDREARDVTDRRGSDAGSMAGGQEERDVGPARFSQGVSGVASTQDAQLRFDLCRAQQRDAAFGDRLGLPPIDFVVRAAGRRRSTVSMAYVCQLARGQVAIRAPGLDSFEGGDPRQRRRNEFVVFYSVEADGKSPHVGSLDRSVC
jgi:hypothetical protein